MNMCNPAIPHHNKHANLHEYYEEPLFVNTTNNYHQPQCVPAIHNLNQPYNMVPHDSKIRPMNMCGLTVPHQTRCVKLHEYHEEPLFINATTKYHWPQHITTTHNPNKLYNMTLPNLNPRPMNMCSSIIHSIFVIFSGFPSFSYNVLTKPFGTKMSFTLPCARHICWTVPSSDEL